MGRSTGDRHILSMWRPGKLGGAWSMIKRVLTSSVSSCTALACWPAFVTLSCVSYVLQLCTAGASRSPCFVSSYLYASGFAGVAASRGFCVMSSARHIRRCGIAEVEAYTAWLYGVRRGFITAARRRPRSAEATSDWRHDDWPSRSSCDPARAILG